MTTNITNMVGGVLRRDDLIEPALSYKIVGVLYRVSNELGPGLQEKYYQKAVAVAFEEIQVNFAEQVPVELRFSGRSVGRYLIDFVVEQKVVVELKRGVRINRKHAQQVLGYLRASGLQLGILAYFSTDGVFFKRIINFPQP